MRFQVALLREWTTCPNRRISIPWIWDDETKCVLMWMICGVIAWYRNLNLDRIMLLVAGIVAPLGSHPIAWQAGLKLLVMNACCNGPCTNDKLQKMRTKKSDQLCDIVVWGLCCQDRPYNDDSTASRLLSEVKHHLARLVLRWGTTLESLVLIFWFSTFSSSTSSFSILSSQFMSRAVSVLLSIILYKQVLLIHITQADTLLYVGKHVSCTECCLALFVLVQKY